MHRATHLVTSLLALALGGLGLVFLVGAQGLLARMVVGGVLLLAAGALLALPRLRPQQIELRQRIELPGDVTLKGMKCRACGASLSADDITVVAGAAHVRCSHCSASYQLEEAPSW